MKPPVVYLPGIDGTGRLLFRQERLNSEFDVRCVSYPQDDRHCYADLVKLGVAALQQTGPATVLAESFGGAVALMVALERPDLVKRLVLVNTFACYPRRLFIDLGALFGPWLPNRPSPQATNPLRSYVFFDRSVPKDVRDGWWERTRDVPMRVYGHRCKLLRRVNLLPRLSEVRIPAVVFAASNDWVVPAPAGRMLAKRLPHAKLLPTLAVGHAAMIDPRIDVSSW